MAQKITLLGASYSDCPAVLLPKTGGGTARFDDASITTATASDVAQGKIFIDSSGNITTGTASGGGGTSFTQLYTSELANVSTTSTSAASVGTLSSGVTFEAGKVYMVSVVDKAGKRNGYFYRCDSYFFIPASVFTNSTTMFSMCVGVGSDGAYNWGTTTRGVYLYRYYGGSNMGDLQIYKRYDSSRGTVNGTYTVTLYRVDIPNGL